MTDRPIVVGDRVRVVPALGQWSGLSGTVVQVEAGADFQYCIRLDAPRVTGDLWFSAPELRRLDDTPHTSSAPLTEGPADDTAYPSQSSATPDPATPDADPAPEAGEAPAHDAAPAPDLIDLLARVGIKTLPWQRRWIEAEFSSARRAEGTESPRLVTDDAEDGSDVGASLPTVGGRAVPPVPAPADTSTEPLVYGVIDEPLFETAGATSVHDDAPVTDLAALRDAAYRLRDVRAEIDALLDVEQTLAARVSEGLGTLVGVPVDLNWGTDRPDALADGAR